MTWFAMGRVLHLTGRHSSVGPAACRGSRPPVQGCPGGAPDGAALTAIRPPQAQAEGRANRRTAAMCLTTLVTCTLLAALPPPATAQALDLDRGDYVIKDFPCNEAPSPAILSFDGRQFGNKGVQCTLQAAGRSGDSYAVTCMEGGDTSTRETQRWTFKRIDRRSFSVNGSFFRFCPVQR